MEPTIKESLYLLFRIIGVMQEIIPSCKETKNIIKELQGFATGDKKSQEIADAIRKYQDFMFNEKNYAGLYIEKKSTYDIKRRYNRTS